MAHGMTAGLRTGERGELCRHCFAQAARAAETKTLRFIMRNDLRVLDPMWTTAYVTRNHGYMVFDTLFALDSSSSRSRRWSAITAFLRTSCTYRFTCATARVSRWSAGARHRLRRLAAALDGAR